MVTSYKGIAVYQPVINGVGGNLVSIQASRLSTTLHKESQLGVLPPSTKTIISPFKIFFAKGKKQLFSRHIFKKIYFICPGKLKWVKTSQISFFFGLILI